MDIFTTFTELDYERLFRPSNLFQNTEELIEFLKVRELLTDEEYNLVLDDMIRMCEEDELYEWCQIIKNHKV